MLFFASSASENSGAGIHLIDFNTKKEESGKNPAQSWLYNSTKCCDYTVLLSIGLVLPEGQECKQLA